MWDRGIEYNFICVLIGRKSGRILLYECYSISLNRYEKQFDYDGHNSSVSEQLQLFKSTVEDSRENIHDRFISISFINITKTYST